MWSSYQPYFSIAWVESFVWFCVVSLCENLLLMMWFREVRFLGRFFSCCTLVLFFLKLSGILVSLIALPSCVDMIGILICGNSFIWFLDLHLNLETLWGGAGSALLILLVGKFNLFYLIVIINLVLFWCKNAWISPWRKNFEDAWILPHRNGFFALFVLLKLLVIIWGSIRFVPCNLFFLWLYFISINLSSKLAWSTVFVSELGLVISTGLLISWRNGYVGLLLLHLMLLLNPRLMVEVWSNLFYRYYFGRLLFWLS